jgi:hypothetical protein
MFLFNSTITTLNQIKNAAVLVHSQILLIHESITFIRESIDLFMNKLKIHESIVVHKWIDSFMNQFVLYKIFVSECMFMHMHHIYFVFFLHTNSHFTQQTIHDRVVCIISQCKFLVCEFLSDMRISCMRVSFWHSNFLFASFFLVISFFIIWNFLYVK